MIKTISVNNRTMRYISFGSGSKNMIILPGLSVKYVTDSAQSIIRAYSAFADDYTIYLFDRVDNPPEGYTVDDMAEDTYQAMIDLNIDHACIFGASQGGMMGQCIAINHPEFVQKLVLGSTSSRFNEKGIRTISTWAELADNKEQEKLANDIVNYIYSEKTVEKFGNILLSGLSSISDEEFKRFSLLVKACDSFDVYDRLENISASVLVIGCYGDKILGPEASEEIITKLNCSQYMYSDEYGHGVYDEAPDYKDHIKDFFDK